jgi:glycosyltransferase involved in cell wall biosynthesis
MESIARLSTVPVLQSIAPRLQFWWRARPALLRPPAPPPKALAADSLAWLLAPARVRRNYVRRRVVHVCGSLAPGGAERQVANTLAELARARLESLHLVCTYLAPDGPGRHRFFAAKVEAAGVALRQLALAEGAAERFAGLSRRGRARLPWLLPELVDEVEAYYRIFRELRPEVVHSWLDYCNVRAGLAAVLAGVPLVLLSGRNLNPSRFALHQDSMAPAYQALARKRNVLLINNSEAGAADYADWLGLPRARFQVVYNGVDLGPEAARDEAGGRTLRAELGIPAAAPLVGAIFGFRPEKRPQLWLETAAAVRAARPDAWFLLVGDGVLREEVAAAAERLGLGDRLVLAGIRADVAAVLAALDVLLLTSAAEGTPNVALEAQQFGTPVVATAGGGTAEAIEHGVTGWVLHAATPPTLAERVLAVLADPALAARARTAGPAFVQRRFGLRRMARQTLDLYGYDSRVLDHMG